MKPVEIYTTPLCGYCAAAKSLLARKGISYTEIDVSRDPDLRAAMMQRAHGRRTVPQIFVGETHVGGFDDMAALDRAGKLDPLLAG
ncbi:glutaredoxin 3 [Halovulum dunhuangense]|uniref:Glutaredoxin n=1 Tax=Halovulum dunhuangense TaxID=1505036 RepID=A0A849KV39_9RHOB|nr:glutaredoxin 3 [Halovulum dunhuangense]NNU79228.1 glutaredoxin 3 [Halovulum dunhuangense]